MAKAKNNQAATLDAFAGLGDLMAGSMAGLTENNGVDFSFVRIEEIQIYPQIRQVLSDSEQSIEELAESIKAQGVLQPILLRPQTGAQPFALVAGERRLRASTLAGLEQIPAVIREMTDEQAEDAQMAENIQRKNFTNIEAAERIQRDLDKLGSVELVLAKHKKGNAWLSKMLAMLALPEQAQRLVDEQVSADIEVINSVKTIEKADPAAAKALVDDLKATRGKPGENARKKVQEVKDQVKPPKKPREPKKDKPAPSNPDNVATSKDRSHEDAGPVTSVPVTGGQSVNDVFGGLGQDFGAVAGDTTPDAQESAEEPADTLPPLNVSDVPALAPAEALGQAYSNIFECGANPKTIIEVMPKDDRENCENWLRSFYEVGVSAKDVSRAVIQGFRNGQFATDGHGAFALAAFLYGTDSEAKFSMLNVLGSVKP